MIFVKKSVLGNKKQSQLCRQRTFIFGKAFDHPEHVYHSVHLWLRIRNQIAPQKKKMQKDRNFCLKSKLNRIVFDDVSHPRGEKTLLVRNNIFGCEVGEV